MSAIGDEQVGCHLLLSLFIHRRDGHIEVLDGQGRNGSVAQMFAQPGKVLRKRLDELLVELVDEGHLSHHHHSLGVAVQLVYQFLIVSVIDIQPLIAGDDTHIGKLLRRKAIDRFGDGYIDMHRSFSVMRSFQDGLVNQAVAMPFILVGMHFGQVH